MKKILCPTDFSDVARNATAYAAKLAQVLGYDLTLLNVQSLFDLAPVEWIRGKEMSIKSAFDQLDEQSKEISKTFKIACYAEVEPTARRLSKVIRDKAKSFDLIIMGSNGADDLYQFLSGSNTYNAIVQSETPVLLIPEGLFYKDIKKIVYAFDYFRDGNLPLIHLKPFMKTDYELTILQVTDHDYELEEKAKLQNLQDTIRNFYGEDIQFTYDTITGKDIARTIDSYMIQHDFDMLALCSVHRSLLERAFHKSIIKTISAVCNYPFFVFHR